MSATAKHLFPALLAVALGAVVQGVLGFGCSLVWMSLFPLFTTVPEAVGVLQPLAIGLNTLLLSQLWKHAKFRDLVPLTTSAPIGIAFGLWAVTSWSAHIINGLLGVFLLLYVVHNLREGSGKDKQKTTDQSKSTKALDDDSESMMVELIDPKTSSASQDDALVESNQDDDSENDRPNPRTKVTIAFPAGFIGGCLTSAFGTGGPAILVFAREAGWESQPQKFRANLQVIFFSMNVLAISSQTYAGIINQNTFKASAMLIPALVLGGFVGNSLASKVRKDIFRILVLGGLTIMGALFLFKAVQEQQRLASAVFTEKKRLDFRP